MPLVPVEAWLPLSRSVDVPSVVEEPMPPVVPEVLVLGDGARDDPSVVITGYANAGGSALLNRRAGAGA